MSVVLNSHDQRSARAPHVFKRHEDLLDPSDCRWPHDRLSIEEIMLLVPALPIWPDANPVQRSLRLTGTRRVLTWLQSHPGDGWQQRWVSSGAEAGTEWFDTVDPADLRSRHRKRTEISSGLTSLMLCRVMLPSYGFLTAYNPYRLLSDVRRTMRPDLFAGIEQRAAALHMHERHVEHGLAIIAKMVLHTGRNPDQLTARDILACRAWSMQRTPSAGDRSVHLAWDLLLGVADLGEHDTLRDALRFGPRPTAELVDAYGLRCRPVRDVLVRYLDERRPGQDYRSIRGLVGCLAGTFWADIERHHPDIDSLHLPDDVAEAWKQRARVVINRNGATRPRKGYLHVLRQVRAFYLDIQEWAQEDPSWAPWAVPSPVRKGETDGTAKLKKRTTAEMHQRVRDRLPALPLLVDTAQEHRKAQAAFLAAATDTAIGRAFTWNGHEYRRVIRKSYIDGSNQGRTQVAVVAEDLTTGERSDLTRDEDEAFWAWAVIETLRHTGVRVEELVEIAHLALVSYKLPDTGEIVPMLQIVPSKGNEERLLLVSPELASVLASIITRLRQQNGGTVPVTARYDSHERTVGVALPHLFQRRHGWRWQVPSYRTIQALLNQALARTSLRDAAGQPLRCTPHDFRRMFATEAVTGGLPVHIVARLLGHANINTTQAYMAVFDDELVRTYRAFIQKRRAERPQAEYREPTEDEWREFQQHFQTRKLELGECARPYGTPCKHEHACIRCPSLRVDPRARPRLVEIIANLNERIQDAKLNGWLGEAQGLQTSLKAAANKLVSLDRARDQDGSGPTRITDLGIPVIKEPPRDPQSSVR